MMARVSVIIPTYNCVAFLPATLRSVLAQTYTDYEVVVVDDGSTDETPRVLELFRASQARIRYLSQANGGAAAARNFGLAHARGEFVAYLDADDLWYPAKLERQVAYLDAHPGVDVLHTEFTTIDDRGSILHAGFNRETGRPVPRGRCATDLLRRCHVQLSTVMERRDWVRRLGGFDPSLVCAEDYLRWIRLGLAGAVFGYLAEPLVKYRWRIGSLSRDERRMLDQFEQLFRMLLRSGLLEERGGPGAVRIVEERLYELHLRSAYLDRQAGRAGDARRRMLRVLGRWPLRWAPYRELAKACVPAPLAERIRRARAHPAPATSVETARETVRAA
jgi:glycosyltransferase involved in cell wall biosynthesis